MLKSSILWNYNVSIVHMPNFIAFGLFVFKILPFEVLIVCCGLVILEQK